MNTRKFPCPLCGHPLTEPEYVKITGRWEQLQDLEAKYRTRLRNEVDQARRRERQRVSKDLLVKERKIVALTGQLKSLKAQSERGLTPPLEGLLYEKELARQLSQRFRPDQIISAGKGGDVIQHVNLNGKRVGTIVYEYKKVARLQKAHVEQARLAMVQRCADFSIVVTTARAGNTFGFWLYKDVLLIHPSGVLALTAWLRTSLIELAKARLPKTAREKVVREVLSFLGSPEFKNPLQDAIRRSEDLGRQLRDEVQSHEQAWSKRFNYYRAIWLDSRNVAHAVTRLIEAHGPNGGGRTVRPNVQVGATYPLEKAALLPSR